MTYVTMGLADETGAAFWTLLKTHYRYPVSVIHPHICWVGWIMMISTHAPLSDTTRCTGIRLSLHEESVRSSAIPEDDETYLCPCSC